MDKIQKTNSFNGQKNFTAYRVICEILAQLKINSAQFCAAIGVNPTYVNDAKKGKTKKITEEVAGKILSIYPEFSRIWLLTGEGEMLRQEVVNTAEGNTNVGSIVQGQNVTTTSPEDAARYDRLISLLEKEHEERSRLLAIIENLTNK